MSFIYAIQSPYPRLMKIGFSKNPKARLAELQVGSPRKLRLLDQWPGTAEQEREIHSQIATLRQHGEWFKIGYEQAAKVIETVTGNKSVSYIQNMEGSLAIFQRAFDQFLEAGGRARLHQMPQSTILAIEIHGALKCHNPECQAWTTLTKCPECGSRII